MYSLHVEYSNDLSKYALNKGFPVIRLEKSNISTIMYDILKCKESFIIKVFKYYEEAVGCVYDSHQFIEVVIKLRYSKQQFMIQCGNNKINYRKKTVEKFYSIKQKRSHVEASLKHTASQPLPDKPLPYSDNDDNDDDMNPSTDIIRGRKH